MSELNARNKKLYKKPPPTFGIIKNIRVSLGHEQQARRRRRRTRDFEENRKRNDVSPCSVMSQNESNEQNEVKLKILKWKAERMRKKKAQEAQKKPPFIVGIVRHHIYSPVSTTKFSIIPMRKKKTVTQPHKDTNIKRITKATEKRLLAKANNETKPKTILVREKSTNDEVKINKQASFAPLNHKFKPPDGLPKISFEEAFVGSPLIENNIFTRDKSSEAAVQKLACYNSNSVESVKSKVSSNERKAAAQKSACYNSNSAESIKSKVLSNKQKSLDSSRKKQNSTEKLKLNSKKHSPLQQSLHTFNPIKKDNCSKYLISFSKDLNNTNEKNNTKKNKLDNSDQISSSVSSLSDTLTVKGDEMKNLDVPEENNKYTVEYFKCVMDTEKNKLQKLCEEWTVIQSQDDITEDNRYLINQAVGQTIMLIKAKFKQFDSLIRDCKRNDGDVLVTCMDLHGFWDMMYLEVKNCNSRFAKLEKLRARCWQEDQSYFAKSTSPKKKTSTKKKIVPAKRSLQALILSDKKKQMAEIQDDIKNSQQMVNNECIMSCVADEKAENISKRSSNVSHNKRFLKIPKNYMSMPYTSTPISDVRSNLSSHFNTPLITMKISQIYNNKLLNEPTLDTTPKDLIEKSERPRKESLNIKLASKDLDDHLAMIKSTDEKLEINQTSNNSPNKSELDSKKGNSDSGLSQTVIEKSIRGMSMVNTLSTPRVTSLNHVSRSITFSKTPSTVRASKADLDDHLAMKKSTDEKLKIDHISNNSPKKNLTLDSKEGNADFGLSQTLIEKPIKGMSMVNTLSTPRVTSLNHISRNIRFSTTPSTVRVSINSNTKRSIRVQKD
ncbi:PREDICTED: disks large-associated protein 5-like [Wasmannia auropunctata]|uniref:disks large-associated protein 5-like n=1 Tax=Wasmannia auropunctata TaxID=64793 RepID=UPI0005EFC0C9|nr:PREDICTED: disks large-associated protein 5-like [Wasmannia auropunctata]